MPTKELGASKAFGFAICTAVLRREGNGSDCGQTVFDVANETGCDERRSG
jgi:hypothetical protein